MTKHLGFLKPIIEAILSEEHRKVFQEKWHGEWSALGLRDFLLSFIEWAITTLLDYPPKRVPD